jgi:hypothetical protein
LRRGRIARFGGGAHESGALLRADKPGDGFGHQQGADEIFERRDHDVHLAALRPGERGDAGKVSGRAEEGQQLVDALAGARP